MNSTTANIGTGGSPAAPTGDGATLVVLGSTAVTLSRDNIDDLLEQIYKNGGITSYFLMGPKQRRVFSKLVITNSGSQFVTNQLHQTSPRPAAGIGTVGVYLSDFAQHDVVLGRHVDDKSMLMVDERHYEVVTLPGRNFTVIPLARSGDAEKYLEVVEFALKVNAPKAHGGHLNLATS